MTSFYYYDQNPSFVLLSCANWGFCYLKLTGVTKFKYERKYEQDSGCSSKMTPSCKWPIIKAVEENLLHHVAMAAKFLDDNKLKASCKR